MGIRRMLLSGVAIAIVAITGPAAAQGAEWTHEGEPLAEHTAIGLSGSVGFNSPWDSYSCATHATLTTQGGETAKIVEFTPTLSECAHTGLGECTPKNIEPTDLPWTVWVNEEDLSVVSPKIDFDFEVVPLKCFFKSIDIYATEITVEFDNQEAFSSLVPSGNGIADYDGVEKEVEFYGELSVTGGDAGTYGIG